MATQVPLVCARDLASMVEGGNMRLWVHALSIAAGIGAAVGFTLWSVSGGGVRSAAHYSLVADASMSPKNVVIAFEKMGIDGHDPKAAVLRYFAPDMIDHDPAVAGDRASVIAYLDAKDWSKPGPERKIIHMVADGDMVMVHHHLVREPGTKGIAAVDMFRVKDGMIVEHWDVLQPVPEISVNKTGMF
jgi:predicted SnoaL-like aldol condensation-catalyzing enzyme